MKKSLLIASAFLLATEASAAAFDGFYAGVNAGYTRASNSIAAIYNDSEAGKIKAKKGALTIGLQTGYAMTFSNHLYTAVELGFNYDGFSKSKRKDKMIVAGAEQTVNSKLQKLYSATLALKGGYNFGPGVGYVGAFGGLASYKASATMTPVDISIKHNKNAFIFGPLVGAELKVTEALTAGLEGRFELARTSKKKQPNAGVNTLTTKSKTGSVSVLARLNYAF